jgi:hypothetical protein
LPDEKRLIKYRIAVFSQTEDFSPGILFARRNARRENISSWLDNESTSLQMTHYYSIPAVL